MLSIKTEQNRITLNGVDYVVYAKV